MREKEIPKIKDMILEILGEDCEKIILFGSYAYGTPREESDIDIYVLLKDGSKNPLLARESVYDALWGRKQGSVDVLANYKSRFEMRSKLPSVERVVANKGVVLYDRV